jgi:serine/alanine adding enzyme
MAIGEIHHSVEWPMVHSATDPDHSIVDKFITIKEYSEIPDWDKFVQQHPKGSIFHTSAMQRSESQTKNRFPFAIGALDSQGNLCALLAAVKIETLDWVHTQLSSRSVFYSEPLFLNSSEGRQGIQQLIRKHDDFMRSQVLFAEVRPTFSTDQDSFDPLAACGYERLGYLNYELRIDLKESEIFSCLSAKRRNNVRSASRKGVEVREVEFETGIDILYHLLTISHANSKTPLVHKDFFKAAYSHLPEKSMRILIAYYQNTPLAGGCFLSFKNRVICWFAGTRRVPGIAGTSMVFWEAIRLYAALGFEIFDLAGAGWEGEEYGPGKFKSKFGGELIHCDRYRKVYSPLKKRLAEAAFAKLRQWIAPSSSQDKNLGS